MSEIDQIHVFDDPVFQRTILRLSAAAVAGGVLAGLLWWLGIEALNDALGLSMAPFELGSLNSLWPWVVSLVLVTLVALVAHELVHGFLFKQFAPPGARVSYGVNWRRGMAYACAEGIVYPRRHYEVIILAPTVVVTLGLVALGLGLGWPLWTFAAATAHLSGCAGDWGYLLRMHKNPDIRWCEDTSWGVRFFGATAAEMAADKAAAATGAATAAGTVGRPVSNGRSGYGLTSEPHAGQAHGPAAYGTGANAEPEGAVPDASGSAGLGLDEEVAGRRGEGALGGRLATTPAGEVARKAEAASGQGGFDVPAASASEGFEVASPPRAERATTGSGRAFVLVDGGAGPAAVQAMPRAGGGAESEAGEGPGAWEGPGQRAAHADAGDAAETDVPAGEA